MAKKRRIKQATTESSRSPAVDNGLLFDQLRFNPRLIALGLLSGAIVYVMYFPSDSVAVEKGEGLWFCFLCLVIATIAWTDAFWASAGKTATADQQSSDSSPRSLERLSKLVDLMPWLLALWMVIAAFASSPPGNLRMASNEAWLWIGGAALFTGTRRLLNTLPARQILLLLLIVCSSALAMHGMHQQLISLPENRAAYQQDPDRVLRLARIDAPQGSAERMIFENRLFDGGPTGTFALANSLAAVLLVGVIGAIGVLRIQWVRLSGLQRSVWVCVLLLCIACLVAARSRSAILAVLLGGSLVFLLASQWTRTRPKVVLVGLLGLAGLGSCIAIGLAIFGNAEWFEQAPASLAFRFQYWRSTWQLALDRPWFGAGPGNFQSIYERYREASATEQIAEPHNFVFETLASGGFVALALLFFSGVFLVRLVSQKSKQRFTVGVGESSPSETVQPQPSGAWMALGAALGLLMVWLVSVGTPWSPDLEAHLFAVPTAAFLMIVLWPSVCQLSRRDVDTLAIAIVLALGLHLMVAGGWTVPGVAILIWSLLGLLGRSDHQPIRWQRSTRTTRAFSLCALLLGVMLLLTLMVISIWPVQENAREMSIAESAQINRATGQAEAALERAIEADPWSIDATLWLADFYRWRLVLDRDTPELRQKWESILDLAKHRAGDDPAVYRRVGAQQLHVFQRHGLQQDLDSAAKTFDQATSWSPASEWLAAQSAVIAGARGQPKVASQLANRARFLSQLGGNIERALHRQQVYLASPLGAKANGGPIRQSADGLLANHFDR